MRSRSMAHPGEEPRDVRWLLVPLSSSLLLVSLVPLVLSLFLLLVLLAEAEESRAEPASEADAGAGSSAFAPMPLEAATALAPSPLLPLGTCWDACKACA